MVVETQVHQPPAYRPVLEAHGWGELGPELTALSKRGEWEKMGTLITDEVLDAFAIVASPKDVPDRLLQRYGGLIDRVACTFDIGDDDDRERAMAKLSAG